MRIIKAAGSASGAGAAPDNAFYFTMGLNTDLVNEISISEADESTISATDIHFLWDSAATRLFTIENTNAGGTIGVRVRGGASASLSLWSEGDTIARVQLSSGAAALEFGPGGAAAMDASILRNSLAVLEQTLTTFTAGATLDSSQTLRFRNPANTFQSTFVAGAQTADLGYTLPTTVPTAGDALVSTAGGVLSWDTPAAQFGISDDAFVIAMAVAL